MEVDLVDAAAAAFVALAVVALAVAIFWPLDRHDDVMSRVHGDQPQLPQ